MLVTMRRNTMRSAVLGLTLAGVVGTGLLGVSAAEAAPPMVKSDDRSVVTTLIEPEKPGPGVIVERDPGGGTRHADVTPKNQPRATVEIDRSPDPEVTQDAHDFVIREAIRDAARVERESIIGEADLEYGPGGPTLSVGIGVVDGVKDDLRPVERLELDRLLEEFSQLLSEDLVDIDITGKLLELGDRLAALFETIQEGIGGAHKVGDEGIDAAEEFGWMYDLSKLLDELFGDDPDEEEGTPDGQGAWDDPDGDWVPNWLDSDDDDDGTPDDEDADPYDPEVSIMAGGEAGPMGTPPVPPMGLTAIDSIRSSVIDVVLMLGQDAASELIEYGFLTEKEGLGWEAGGG